MEQKVFAAAAAARSPYIYPLLFATSGEIGQTMDGGTNVVRILLNSLVSRQENKQHLVAVLVLKPIYEPIENTQKSFG